MPLKPLYSEGLFAVYRNPSGVVEISFDDEYYATVAEMRMLFQFLLRSGMITIRTDKNRVGHFEVR